MVEETEKDKENNGNEILINIMYNGEYLDKNIGHEVINLIKCDNKKHYIYVNPYGTMGDGHKIGTILLARRCEYKNTLEILAKATGLHECFPNKPNEPSEIEKAKKAYNKDGSDLKKLNKSYIKNGMRKATNEKIKEVLKSLEGIISEGLKKTIDNRIEYQSNKPDPSKNEESKLSADDWKEISECLKYKRGKAFHKAQMDYIENEDKPITYGNKNLEEIFKNNYGNEYSIYTTFLAEKVVRPENKLYITTDDSGFTDKEKMYIKNINKECNDNEKCNFAKSSLKMYFGAEKNNTDSDNQEQSNQSNKVHTNLQEIIDGDFWDENNEDKKIKTIEEERNKSDKTYKIAPENDFIGIIKQDYDELIFSNLFGYIFSYTKGFIDFANDVLLKDEKKEREEEKSQIKFDENAQIEIIREKENNIDLLILIKDHVFVIENKIKSGINGKRESNKGKETQLTKYAAYIYNTEKYKDITHKHFFIFEPNYNKINEEELKVKITNKENEYQIEYKPIKYKDIYTHFNSEEIVTEYEKNGIKYIKEFIVALEKHIHNVDNIQERNMFKRFMKRIEEL